MDALWRIALETSKAEVVKKVGHSCAWLTVAELIVCSPFVQSIAFLNQLHERLSSTLKADLGKIRASYISKCMGESISQAVVLLTYPACALLCLARDPLCLAILR
jgi:hypothetical protein